MSTLDMKNKIVAWFQERNLDPMNTLQGQLGIISDNAITLDDVCANDIGLVNYMIMSGELESLL
jgi:hypothetical protein